MATNTPIEVSITLTLNVPLATALGRCADIGFEGADQETLGLDDEQFVTLEIMIGELRRLKGPQQ